MLFPKEAVERSWGHHPWRLFLFPWNFRVGVHLGPWKQLTVFPSLTHCSPFRFSKRILCEIFVAATMTWNALAKQWTHAEIACSTWMLSMINIIRPNGEICNTTFSKRMELYWHVLVTRSQWSIYSPNHWLLEVIELWQFLIAYHLSLRIKVCDKSFFHWRNSSWAIGFDLSHSHGGLFPN